MHMSLMQRHQCSTGNKLGECIQWSATRDLRGTVLTTCNWRNRAFLKTSRLPVPTAASRRPEVFAGRPFLRLQASASAVANEVEDKWIASNVAPTALQAAPTG